MERQKSITISDQDFDIHQQMTPLRKLYPVTLTYFLKVKNIETELVQN